MKEQLTKFKNKKRKWTRPLTLLSNMTWQVDKYFGRNTLRNMKEYQTDAVTDNL